MLGKAVGRIFQIVSTAILQDVRATRNLILLIVGEMIRRPTLLNRTPVILVFTFQRNVYAWRKKKCPSLSLPNPSSSQSSRLLHALSLRFPPRVKSSQRGRDETSRTAKCTSLCSIQLHLRADRLNRELRSSLLPSPLKLCSGKIPRLLSPCSPFRFASPIISILSTEKKNAITEREYDASAEVSRLFQLLA